MTPRERLVTVHENASREEAIEQLHKHRIEKVLMVNDAFELRGMITVKDIRRRIFPMPVKTDKADYYRVQR